MERSPQAESTRALEDFEAVTVGELPLKGASKGCSRVLQQKGNSSSSSSFLKNKNTCANRTDVLNGPREGCKRPCLN